MQLTIRSGNPAAEACDALVIPVAADKRLSGPAAAEHGRLAGGAAVQGLSGMTIGSLVVVLPERADARFVQGLTEGLALASYRFDRYRDPQEPETAVESVTLLAATEQEARALQAAFDRALILSDAICLARDLVNEPPNHLTPTALADRAVDLAGACGLQSRVLGPAELADQGFGALLGVAQGAPRSRASSCRSTPARKRPPLRWSWWARVSPSTAAACLKTAGMEDMKISTSGRPSSPADAPEVGRGPGRLAACGEDRVPQPGGAWPRGHRHTSGCNAPSARAMTDGEFAAQGRRGGPPPRRVIRPTAT